MLIFIIISIYSKAFRFDRAFPTDYFCCDTQSSIETSSVTNNHLLDIKYSGVEAAINKMMQPLIKSVFSILCITFALISTVDGAATQFTLPKDDVIVCSDSLENVCMAPTSCNANGKAVLDAGNNLNVGSATQDNGVWVIKGGYTIDFPSICNVTCKGNCTCETCTTIEVDNFAANEDIGMQPTSSASNINRIAALSSITMLVAVMASCIL